MQYDLCYTGKLQAMTEIKQPVNYAAANIKELRKETGMSRRELVDKLAERGVSLHQTSLRRVEEGEQAVKIEEAIAMADIFGMTLEQFVTSPVDRRTAFLENWRKNLKRSRNLAGEALHNWNNEREIALARLESGEFGPLEQSASVKEIHELVHLDDAYDMDLAQIAFHLLSGPEDDGEG